MCGSRGGNYFPGSNCPGLAKSAAIHSTTVTVFPPILKFSFAVTLTCLHSVSDLYTHVSCISDDSNYTLGNKSLIKCGNKLWKDIMHVKKNELRNVFQVELPVLNIITSTHIYRMKVLFSGTWPFKTRMPSSAFQLVF